VNHIRHDRCTPWIQDGAHEIPTLTMVITMGPKLLGNMVQINRGTLVVKIKLKKEKNSFLAHNFLIFNLDKYKLT
jgi:hypothetical protein